MTRLGYQIPNFTYPGIGPAELFDVVARQAREADTSGFDTVLVMDHFYQISVNGARTEPMLEAYSLLAAIAARTEHAQLGTMVTGVTYRNPALLAKTVTTLDVISAGRAILGIGAAWNDDEHAGYGFDFPPLRERFERIALRRGKERLAERIEHRRQEVDAFCAFVDDRAGDPCELRGTQRLRHFLIRSERDRHGGDRVPGTSRRQLVRAGDDPGDRDDHQHLDQREGGHA